MYNINYRVILITVKYFLDFVLVIIPKTFILRLQQKNHLGLIVI